MTALGKYLALLSMLAGPAYGDSIVRGLDGQTNLRLDYGRSLAHYPLTGASVGGKPLRPIEQARLDARKLLRASSLPRRDAVEQVVKIVQQQMPYSPSALYDAFGAKELQGRNDVPLSEYVKQHVGICRERAFLLAKMLREGGLAARPKFGVVYDRKGRELGGHAWVETKIDGKLSRVDPNVPHSVSVGIRRLPVDETLPDGTVRKVKGSRSRSWLYLPTGDLEYLHGPGDPGNN